MPKLLYSATGADGKPTEGIVDAATVQDARQRLEGQGLSGVVMYSAPGYAIDEAEVAGLGDAELRQLAKLRLTVMARPGLVPALLELARVQLPWLAVAAAVAVYGAYSDSPSWVWIGIAAGVLPFAVLLWNWRHVGRHNQMLKAFAVGQWAEVRRLCKLLMTRRANTPVMNFEFVLRQAYCDVRERTLDKALARVQPWSERLADQPGLFEMRISVLYHAAGDWPNFIRMHEESLVPLPGDPSRTLDLALAHARHGDVDRAAELLAGLDKSLLPPWGAGFVHWAEGLVQLRRQQPQALATLGLAVTEFLKLAAQPMVWTALGFATQDHALALKAAGRADEARQALAQVWPIVKAHAQPALLYVLETEGLAPLNR
jgi:tetratricopeptide (TPR) repeat protein